MTATMKILQFKRDSNAHGQGASASRSLARILRVRMAGPAYTSRMVALACSISILLGTTGCSQADVSCAAEPAKPKIWSTAARSAEFNNVLALLDSANTDTLVDELRKFCGTAGNQQEKQQASYILAKLLVKRGIKEEQPEAIERFKMASLYPPLTQRAIWRGSEVALALQDEKTAQQALEAYAAKETDPKKISLALYTLGQSQLRSDDRAKAKATFTAVRKKYPSTQYAIGSANYLAQIVIADAGTSPTQEDVESAAALYREYLQRCPDGRYAIEIVNRMKSGIISTSPANGTPSGGGAPGASPNTSAGASSSTGSSDRATTSSGTDSGDSGKNSQTVAAAPYVPTKSDKCLFGDAYYEAGNWAQALREWDASENCPVKSRRAICLAKTGKVQEAIALTVNGVKQNPADTSFVEAAAAICKPLSREDSKALWQQILACQPARADIALWNVASREDSPDRAVPLYKMLLSRFPNSPHMPEASWWTFWYMVKPGPKTSKQQLINAIALADSALKHDLGWRVATRFLFWRGKVYEKLGDKESAKVAYQRAHATYPWNYYGHRALARLSVLSAPPVMRPAQAGVPSKPSPPADKGWRTLIGREYPQLGWRWPEPPSLAEFEQACGSTVATMMTLHQYDEALDLLPSGTPPNMRAWLYTRVDKPLDAINTAGLKTYGVPGRHGLWLYSFPLLYSEVIANEAKAWGVDPMLVHGLIREESRYNAKALSSSKAIGLMQLLPGTAYGVAKHIGVKLNNKEEIFRPDINLKFGTEYLSYVLKRYNGNAMLAVASYNGGPNAVARWVKQHQAAGISDPDVFVENIPFRETRDYVRKVFGSYWNYEQIYCLK